MNEIDLEVTIRVEISGRGPNGHYTMGSQQFTRVVRAPDVIYGERFVNSAFRLAARNFFSQLMVQQGDLP